MKLLLLAVISCFFSLAGKSQTQQWSTHIDTVTTFSSPRSTHLNADSIADIVIGAGLDGSAHANGVVAIDGANGAVLWTFAAEEEIFTSAQFYDINGDNIDDVFIGGRYAEFYAIDGATGQMLWEFFSPPPTQAVDSGWFNFYTPQWIPDQNGDSHPDLLIANGGNHALPSFDTSRAPGYLMVLDAMTGGVLAKDTMPDGEESYCSPVLADFSNSNIPEIIFGSGGEDDGGALWRVRLSELMANNIQSATQLAVHPTRGFIAPASLADMNDDGTLDIISQAYDGTVRIFDGSSNQLLWEAALPGTESSAAPVIGNFTGDKTPDVFVVLGKGHAPAFSDFYQVLFDGADGTIAWKDSIAQLHFASANAIDLTMDGRDEAIVSLNFHNGSSFSHQLMVLDFQNNQISNLYAAEAGVNLASTPLVQDIDADGLIEIIYAYRADSLNPMGQNGFKISKLQTPYQVPPVGIAWGSYMGTTHDGVYHYNGIACGTLASGLALSNISCNGHADASATANPSGGVAPYTYLWSTGIVADSVGPMDIGSYSLRVTDSVGCYVDQDFSTNNPHVLTFGGLSPPTCAGDSNATIQVASTGCPCMFSTCTYSWSNNGSTTKVGANLWAGWQYVTITHMDGCIVVDSTLIPDAPPLLSTSKVTDLPCSDYNMGLGMIEAFMTNPSNTTLLWSNGSTATQITNLTPGNYSLQLSNTLGCKDSAFFVVKVPDTLDVAASALAISCYGSADGQILVQASGGTQPYNFGWSNGANAQNLTNLDTGFYSLTLADSMGCVERLDSVQIVQPAPFISQATVVDLLCNSDSSGQISVSFTGNQGNASFNWSNGESSQLNTGLNAGIYSLVVSDSMGCSSQIDSIVVSEPAPFTASAQITDLLCYQDASGQISVQYSGNQGEASFLWSNAATTQNLTGVQAGFYQLQMTDSLACSTILDSIEVLEPAALLLSMGANDALQNCDGTASVSVTGGSPSYQFIWSNNSITDSISNLCPGIYTVTVTDDNGCMQTDSISVSLASAFTNPITNSTDIQLIPNPANDLVRIELFSISSGYRVRLYNKLGQLLIGQYNSATAPSIHLNISKLPAGQYTVLVVTDAGNLFQKQLLKL